MKTNKQKIVIVGGGFAGVKAALDMSREPLLDITLISEHDTFRYYPSLYHTATGGSRNVSSIPINEILGETSVTFVKAKVTGLDRATRHVSTDSKQEFAYDQLVLALGVVTNFFHIPGLEEYAYGIKSLEDAEELKQHLHQQIIAEGKPDLNYVIVGGGPTGVELAGVLGDYVNYIMDKHQLKRRKIHIDLIEASPRLMPRLPVAMSRSIAKQLRKRGVRLYLGAKVEGENADELTVNGKPIRSHTVVWTAGMANNPFYAEHGFQTGRAGKVRVDQYLLAEPNIYVLGDNADTPYSGMAQTAIYDGAYIASALITMVRHKDTPRPYSAKKPIYVMPAGPDWAAVLWGSVQIYGRAGWALRRLADFVGYRDYEPLFGATKHWLAEYERQDMCQICDRNADQILQSARP